MEPESTASDVWCGCLGVFLKGREGVVVALAAGLQFPSLCSEVVFLLEKRKSCEPSRFPHINHFCSLNSKEQLWSEGAAQKSL